MPDQRLVTICQADYFRNQAGVNLHMAYYNFCWRPGKMRITPAMAAGVDQQPLEL